jgi:hypothetical protein
VNYEPKPPVTPRKLEVLEAIRNLTEEALVGGGFYSPEGFHFSNM